MPPPRRDFAVLEAELTRWLRQKLPNARSLVVKNLRGPTETGYSSDTLLFDLEGYDEPGLSTSLVAKLHPQGVTVFPRYDLEQQFQLLAWLKKFDAPVPRVLWIEKDTRVLGSVFYVMEFVEGRVPPDNPPYHTSGWLTEVESETRRRLWDAGIVAMAAVHRAPWQQLLGEVFPPVASGQSYLDAQLDDYRHFIDWGLERGRYPLLSRAEAWLQAYKPKEEQVALCWGDARFGNQLFANGKCVALLDWEMARLGDPVQDIAWWWAIDRCFSEGLGLPRLPGLPERGATIALWEKHSGFSAQHFDYYEVLALYKFTAIMARVIRQLCHYGVFPAETTMDRENLASLVLERELERRGG
ncbi:MAG: putative aminoglycoside phosphotransferase [Candidatus Binatia bacterium]|nr:MAG: putative aminoglycoside phosphotransferase [Candidatus Binatia bacterium]